MYLALDTDPRNGIRLESVNLLHENVMCTKSEVYNQNSNLRNAGRSHISSIQWYAKW